MKRACITQIVAGVALAMVGGVSSVQAIPIVTVLGQGVAGAQAAEDDFKASLASGSITTVGFETAEGFDAGVQSATIETLAGDFTREVAGNDGGACDNGYDALPAWLS